MKTVFILFALFALISCNQKPGHHENDSSFSDFLLITETGEIEIRDLNNDGSNDIIIIGIDNNGKRIGIDSLLSNPDSIPFGDLESWKPNLKFEELTTGDFVTYGVNGLDREGNPQRFLFIGDSLITFDGWLKDKESVSSSWLSKNHQWLIPEN